MNLRTLKKFSKRAVPYLDRVGDKRERYPAEKGDSYVGLVVRDMNKLDRHPSAHRKVIAKETHVATIAPKGRKGTKFPYVKLHYPCHPLKGTIMVGVMCGYEEPEWDEQTAWEALLRWVYNQHFWYDPDTDTSGSSIPKHLKPNDIFKEADRLLAAIDRAG